MPPEHTVKIGDILALLDRAKKAHDMAMPGLGLHDLKGRFKGHYAVSVSRNLRVTFRFESGDARDVDSVDYH